MQLVQLLPMKMPVPKIPMKKMMLIRIQLIHYLAMAIVLI
jgi:hypothetical protein